MFLFLNHIICLVTCLEIKFILFPLAFVLVILRVLDTTHQRILFYFCVSGILLLCKSIQWWCHFLQALDFTSIAHVYVHIIWFIYWKMQHNVVLGQAVQNSIMMYYIHNVYECPCQLHMILPKGDKSCLPIHIQSPYHNKVWLSIMGSISCCNQSFHRSWLMCFLFVIYFRCLPYQLNCVWDVIEYLIRTLHTTP
jgi:hypothetical protein